MCPWKTDTWRLQHMSVWAEHILQSLMHSLLRHSHLCIVQRQKIWLPLPAVADIFRSPWRHLRRATTHCSTLQHAATHCNTPLRVVTIWWPWAATDILQSLLRQLHLYMVRMQWPYAAVDMRGLLRYWRLTATHCNTLQHSATHYCVKS